MGLGAARARPLCRLPAARGAWSAVRPDPSGRGAPHPRLSRPLDQAPAAHGALARRAAHDCWTSRAISRSQTTDFISGRAISPKWARANRTLSRSPNAFWRRPISGAAGRRRGSTARAWSRRRWPQPAWRARATATCRRRRWASPSRSTPAPLARGDLVFWKGHVGIMRDPATLLHANGWHMKTASEPLAEARKQIAASGGGEATSVRRLPARG